MKSTQYLYGIEPEILKEMNYKEALEYKKEKAKKLLHKITYELEPGAAREEYQSNWFRQKNVLKAIEYCDALLDELNGKALPRKMIWN